MPLYSLTDDERRRFCREAIESIEYWLRRLIDETFTQVYGKDYLYAKDEQGSNIIKSQFQKEILGRISREPERYHRPIDAALLDNLIDIICNPVHYKEHFKDALVIAFPDGNSEARTFLKRISEKRNKLAHANAISVREAEQIVCYSRDVIDSLKYYYRRKNLFMDYNVPRIIKFTDSFGNIVYESQFNKSTSVSTCNLFENPANLLRPDDTLTIEIEVDPSFDESQYTISWSYRNMPLEVANNHTKKLIISIKNIHVAEQFHVECKIVSTQEWHRHGYYDDSILIVYKVLPPL